MSLTNSLRLNKEFLNINKQSDTSNKLNISAELIDDKLDNWIICFNGPEETLYENGIFKLNIKFPINYPFTAPQIKFITKMYHPNISPDGSVCLEILKEKWIPGLTIENVILSICVLLNTPNPSNPYNSDAANLYVNDIESYNSTVIKMTKKYAK